MMELKRLTTDSPKDNIENSMNLFYIKDQWTWVRGCGPAPDYADMSLCDFVRTLVKSNIPDAAMPENDDDLSMMMAEWLMDEPDTAEGIISLLYTAGWAFAELRHRLAYYEDLEEQGRLVVLPCKVGDSYYTIDRECTDEDGEVQHPTGSDCEWCCKEECDAKLIVSERCFATVIQILMYERHLGKTVFLTREEAEQALKGGAN